MDGLYEQMNHCKTNMGEIVLYIMLRNPEYILFSCLSFYAVG